MRGQRGFFDLDECYERLGAVGGSLERLNSIIHWPVFKKPLANVPKRSDGAGGAGVPAVPMFMFLGLNLSDKAPDAKTIWLIRESLIRAGSIDNLFARFDKHLSRSGYLAKIGQIVDAMIILTPRQYNSQDEKEAIKAGKMPQD